MALIMEEAAAATGSGDKARRGGGSRDWTAAVASATLRTRSACGAQGATAIDHARHTMTTTRVHAITTGSARHGPASSSGTWHSVGERLPWGKAGGRRAAATTRDSVETATKKRKPTTHGCHRCRSPTQ